MVGYGKRRSNFQPACGSAKNFGNAEDMFVCLEYHMCMDHLMQQNPGFHSLHSWELWIFTSPCTLMIASFVRPIRTRFFSPSVVLSSSCPLGPLAVQRRSLSQTQTTRHSRAGKRSNTFGPCMSTTVSDREVSQQLSKSLEIDTSLSCHLIDFVSCLARPKLYRAPCYRITFGYMFGYTHTLAQNSHCEF